MYRKVVAQTTLSMGMSSTIELYESFHILTIKEFYPWEVPARVILDIDGKTNYTFVFKGDDKNFAVRLEFNYYTFEDGTGLYIEEIIPGERLSDHKIILRLVKLYAEEEYQLWAQFNSTRGMCRTNYDCPIHRNCQGGICVRFCGNGYCEAGEQDNCPQDCGGCGDGTCSSDENCGTCTVDCGKCETCGDGICSQDEGCGICSEDCTCSETERCEDDACKAYCGNGICENSEKNFCTLDCEVLRIKVDGTEKDIEIKEQMLIVSGFSVRTNLSLTVNELGISMNHGEILKILPDAIPDIFTALGLEDIVSIDLELQEGKPVYKVVSKNEVKLLWLFSRTFVIESTLDAQSGNVQSTEAPWWSFLAFG